MNFKTITAIVLFLIAIVMVYIGITKSVLPPALTGVGFVFIAIVFLKGKK